MKISASIYSDKQRTLEELVMQLDAHGIDMLHVDCADNESVFEDIRAIKKYSQTPIDLHLISPQPEKYFPLIKELEIEFVSIQYELVKSLPDIGDLPKTKFGLAITKDTALDFLREKWVSAFSFVMLMCTEPGKSGGVFAKENFQRIIEVKNQFPSLKIQIDGGVNNEIAFILKLLGVDSVVSGSYLLGQESLSAGMISFFKAPIADNFLVKDFYTPLSYLPIIPKSELNFKKVLQVIEQYKQGFALITDEYNRLEGVISNADVRRGILQQIEHLEKIDVTEMINRTPVKLNEFDSLGAMLKTVNGLNFIVLFLPVTDSDNILKGAVLLNNLTRG